MINRPRRIIRDVCGVCGARALRIEIAFEAAVQSLIHETVDGERWRELEACCRFIGFELLPAAPGGPGRVSLRARAADAVGWARRVDAVAALVVEQAPRAILLPHADDGHTTHVGVHQLMLDALQTLPPSFQTYAVETELWRAARSPT